MTAIINHKIGKIINNKVVLIIFNLKLFFLFLQSIKKAIIIKNGIKP
jgi:hypothetical protein